MIPYDAIDTVFLDVGNTLISIDFEWVAREISSRGLACDPALLRRAEAAARPAISERLARAGSTEGSDAFAVYLRTVLDRLATRLGVGPDGLDELAEALVPVLRTPGEANRLWRSVMPGVPEALERLHDAGLRLVVVSNSDGSVETALRAAGLHVWLDAVVDSGIVGFEKPDPRIFEHALRTCGAAPAGTLHVGDLYHADVRGARAAGLHAALLDPYDDWTAADCVRLPDVAALADRLATRRGR